MDPIALIVSAVVAGAAAGLGDTASQAVKDAYSALKAKLRGRAVQVDPTPVERMPESQAKRDSLAEDLAASGVENDPEVLEAARAVIESVPPQDRAAVARVGIDLERVEAEFVRLRDIRGSEAAVRGRDWKIRGGIEIEGAGGGPSDPQ